MSDGPYPEMLRLLLKYGDTEKETLGVIFIRVASALEKTEAPARRTDLAKMLTAWKFWGDLGEDLQSELLDCIEYTYGAFIARPRSIAAVGVNGPGNMPKTESRRDIWMSGYWAAVNENIKSDASQKQHDWWRTAYERYQSHDGASQEREVH